MIDGVYTVVLMRVVEATEEVMREGKTWPSIVINKIVLSLFVRGYREDMLVRPRSWI